MNIIEVALASSHYNHDLLSMYNYTVHIHYIIVVVVVVVVLSLILLLLCVYFSTLDHACNNFNQDVLLCSIILYICKILYI